MTSARISRVWGTILLTITSGHCERSAAIQTRVVVATTVLLLTLAASAYAQYSGGTGEPNDPYQIATAADLIALGETPEDYDKHFILTADIDLDPNLPGRKVFDRAVIAPDTDPQKWDLQGTPFTGVFDGNGHTILHLTVQGKDQVGLFGQLGEYVRGAEVKNLGLVDVNITASGHYVGGLAGDNYSGTVTQCYSTGVITASGSGVGGLLGWNVGAVAESYSTTAVTGTGEYGTVGGLVGGNYGTVTQCYSTGTVDGGVSVGGLVGLNGSPWGLPGGTVTRCYSTGTVSGKGGAVGGLIGSNAGSVAECYSTSDVAGRWTSIGGLVGENSCLFGATYYGGSVACCYATGVVTGEDFVGGLVGDGSCGIGVTHSYSTGAVRATGACVGGLVGGNWTSAGPVTHSFWNIQTSGQASSAGGTSKTTAEMQAAKTFLDAGWDFADETANGTEDIWKIAEGLGYPRLSWQQYSGGTGEPNDPYQIATAADLIALGETPEDYDKHFILTDDIDLDPNLPGRKVFDRAVIAPDMDRNNEYFGFHGTFFTGVFDGDGHTISGLTITTNNSYLGLFGQLRGGEVKSLGIVNAKIIGSGNGRVGGLVGEKYGGVVTNCQVTGQIKANFYVGALIGWNLGTVTHCDNCATVSGIQFSIGGLFGFNGGTVTQCSNTGAVNCGNMGFKIGGMVGENGGTLIQCCNYGPVSGASDVGGLVGDNRYGGMVDCYSTGAVKRGGGLVGKNWGTVTNCYSTGAVTGGGLVGTVGFNPDDPYPFGPSVENSFWDIETSGQTTSAGCTGKTTAEMQAAKTFLDAGWDFMDETANGTEDIWWIDEGKDYPRLWWEAAEE